MFTRGVPLPSTNLTEYPESLLNIGSFSCNHLSKIPSWELGTNKTDDGIAAFKELLFLKDLFLLKDLSLVLSSSAALSISKQVTPYLYKE